MEWAQKKNEKKNTTIFVYWVWSKLTYFNGEYTNQKSNFTQEIQMLLEISLQLHLLEQSIISTLFLNLYPWSKDLMIYHTQGVRIMFSNTRVHPKIPQPLGYWFSKGSLFWSLGLPFSTLWNLKHKLYIYKIHPILKTWWLRKQKIKHPHHELSHPHRELGSNLAPYNSSSICIMGLFPASRDRQNSDLWFSDIYNNFPPCL